MDQAFATLRSNKEKAQLIIDQANARHDELLNRIHSEAKDSIKGIKDQNNKTLNEIREEYQRENREKTEEINTTTKAKIDAITKNGKERLPEIVDLLYKAVIEIQ